MNFLYMLNCNLQVLLCTEIAAQKDIAPKIWWLLEGPRGSSKKFLGSLSLAIHILWPPHKLWCNSTTAPDPYSSPGADTATPGGLHARFCHAFRVYATSMTSVRPFVCLSVTLVHCDHTVQQKVIQNSTE